MKKLLIGILMLGIVSCVGGGYDYITPMPCEKTDNSIVINKSKDEVWKDIISSVGGSFFVINNLDKESGFINISYNGSPMKYVDCGNINSKVVNVRGERSYSFPAAIPYKQYELVENNNLFFIYRKMNLEGRINIVVQEEENNKTRATVTCRYVVTKKTEVTQPGVVGRNYLNDSISFNTNGSESFPPPGTTCRSNGNLEREILELIK